MTTKKKSLLGIGYLSVAMLGASLLMAKPVSAEEEVSSQDASPVVTIQQGSDTNKQQISQETSHVRVELIEVTENDEERILYSTQDPYLKGREDGYNAGYQDGQKPGAPEAPVNSTPEPSKNPYTTSEDHGKSENYSVGYQDAYGLGYRNGWDNNHYIWSTLKTVWNIITYYLGYSN